MAPKLNFESDAGVVPASIGDSPASPPIIDTVSLLSVSPCGEDHIALRAIFRQNSESAPGGKSRWKLSTSPTLQDALGLMRIRRIPIAICARELEPGTWKEFLDHASLLPHSPLVIVTSRLADERMWAEVLNVGGWDVLAKPFERGEVIRVLESAWLHWNNQHALSAAASHTANTAAEAPPSAPAEATLAAAEFA